MFTVHGERCYLCHRIITLGDFEIDHIIPESLKEKPPELNGLLNLLGLPQGFDIDSAENWLPACRGCNRYKRDSQFEPTPLVQLTLQNAAAKADEVRARTIKFVNDKTFEKLLAQLEGLKEAGKLSPEQAKLVIDVASKVQDSREPELSGQPIRMTPHFSVRTEDGFSFLVPEWEEYEQGLIAEILAAFKLRDVQIQKNQLVPSKKFGTRQVDLILRARFGVFRVVIVIDCTCYARQVNEADVEAFLELVDDISATKGIIATGKDYSPEAEARIRAEVETAADLDLTIFRLGELTSYQSLVALPYKVPGGAILRAPAGWVVDCRTHMPFDPPRAQVLYKGLDDRIPGLAFLYRRGKSYEQALAEDCFMYCNLTAGTRIEAVADYQRKNHPAFEPEWLPLETDLKDRVVGLRRYQLEDGQSQEHTLFLDFGPFVFWVVLITPVRAESLSKWAVKSLLDLAVTTIPFKVTMVSETQKIWKALQSEGEEFEFAVTNGEITPVKETLFSEKIKDGLGFSAIRLKTVRAGTWRQVESYTPPIGLEPFNAEFFRLFELWDIRDYEDPVFDILVKNRGRKNLVILAVGIRLLQVGNYMFGYGEPEPSKIPVLEALSVQMPDLKSEVRAKCKDFRLLSPVDVDSSYSVELADPYLVKPNVNFRYTLQLRGFIENIPNLCFFRFVIFTDEGNYQSPDIFLRGL
ncbi:MAG: restriction endonuclease [Candidatus Eremiobacteraeota bacterium]|nr:restriction endonuclease [Candidatus Eremiobacteraeota bacterium]